ncbi:MAG: acyl-CoA dehydrogenase family protein [Bacillota bacterium]
MAEPLQVDGQRFLNRIRAIADQFSAQRQSRQQRRELHREDFDLLADAGFLRTGVPAEFGGLWQGASASARLLCEALRTLAHGDPSVALVAAMHPAVLITGRWAVLPETEPAHQAAWAEQRRWACQTALDGAWWGTITSEPGSGGDVNRTRTTARKLGGGYRLTGQKHFGSGSGITRYMITTALPEGEEMADWFFMDMQGVPWDGSRGVTLTAPWDGWGMSATQSHAMAFADFPAQRTAWVGDPDGARYTEATRGVVLALFTAVIVGVAEVATRTAREQIRRRESLRPYEEVEWSRCETEAWLIQQAYQGVLRAIEGQSTLEAVHAASHGKVAIAELAESLLQRICRVLGGGTFSRHAPFGYWMQDVRALGFLRPPWGLAYQGLAGLDRQMAAQ